MNWRGFALICITGILAATAHARRVAVRSIAVTDKSFGCISHLKPVRGFCR